MGRSWFYRLGALSYRRRRVVLLVWVAVFAAGMPFLAKLSERLSQGGFEVRGSQSDRVQRALDEEFSGQFTLTDLLVMDAPELMDPAFRSAFGRVRDALLAGPGVAAVSDPYAAPERSISPDGHTLTAVVGLSDDQDQALQHADELNAIVAEASEGTGVRALLTGAPPFYAAFSETTERDLQRAETVALPISLLILVLAFGSVVAAGLPLAMALLGLAVSFALISIMAAATTTSIFTQNVASMIGIGVGIDYSLFIVTRFRERMAAGRDVGEAVAEAMSTSGKAVFVSALAVVVSLSGTTLVNIPAFRSMGLGAVIAVAVAGTAALTLLPALLGMVGRRIDSLHLGPRRRGDSRLWHRWAGVVMRRPWTALVLCLLALGVLAAPARNLRLGSAGPSILPADAAPRVAADITARSFGEGQVAPVQVVVSDPRGVLAGGFDDLYRVVGQIAEDPEVVRVDSVASLVPGAALEQARAVVASPEAGPVIAPLVAAEGTETLISVVTRHGAQSDPVQDFVERLRDLLPGILPAGATAAVGGDPGLNADINREVSSKLVPVVALVLVLSFLVLLLFFRSLLLPLKAILMNTLSVVATYGVLVWVFQDGHLEGLLGFETAGHIESFLPLFLFSILFGLSMDYEVFLLARVREEYLRTTDNAEAVGWGLEHTARIITSAAAIMVTVFGAFAFASLLPIKSMGFGLATAVLLDATIVRVVLVPATMRLMGRWNWWLPAWLDRRLPNVSLERMEEPQTAAEVPATA